MSLRSVKGIVQAGTVVSWNRVTAARHVIASARRKPLETWQDYDAPEAPAFSGNLATTLTGGGFGTLGKG